MFLPGRFSYFSGPIFLFFFFRGGCHVDSRQERGVGMNSVRVREWF